MISILVFGDSMSWGIIPGSRNRLSFDKRWPGVAQHQLGDGYRVIEECLNGRTTQFEDPWRPSRNGLESIQMLMESHSPVDLVVIMLGINDFQDVIGATANDSVEGLSRLVSKLQSLSPEPMQNPADILVVIPPEIQQPQALMAQKFSGFKRGKESEIVYLERMNKLGVATLVSSEHIGLSQVDGIHLDEAEHQILGQWISSKIRDLVIA
ncbi:MAG: SGNH/GDSL hydrolase family protein [Motiliproteus sp.]|nr:SGNH/GDSL hydrolase family protein [Motiliproteus sp.]MCW9052815.1 SGNH/GDSL hydrolase family protein [Motiliproteus sp.]